MFRTMIALTVVAIMAVSVQAWQRSAPLSIQGTVVDGKGAPVYEAKVEFWLVTTYGRWLRVTATTDRSGKYEIMGVPEAKGIGMAWGSDSDRGPVEMPVEVGPHPNVYHFML